MTRSPFTIGAPSMEARLDAGEPFCSIGDHFTDGEETTEVNGERCCAAHAAALLTEEEGRLLP